ncbi:uncharacterized protein BDV17DRAFT_294244 [Aspergillus undulatus]|uniref:uncharacterized protein n=1 Tax=Aspergillus undulatus TaxID=1810928 RepID=UPI003CCD07C5
MDPRITAEPRSFLVRRGDPSSQGIGKRTNGLAVSETGQLRRAFGTVTKILMFPLFAFVVPIPVPNAQGSEGTGERAGPVPGSESFQPFTYNALKAKEKKLYNKIVFDRPRLDDIIENGIWLDREGRVMVGKGRVIQVEAGSCYVYIVEPLIID